MKGSRRIGVALGVILALTAAGTAAASVNPPAGTPNMAAMVLQSPDLAPGAVAGQQGFVKPPSGFSAQYDAEFTQASTPDGISYYSISDFVAIAPSAATVDSFLGEETSVFRSKAGHKLLSAVIIHAAGKKAHLEAKDVKYHDLGSLGVGQSSFVETIGVKAKRVSVHEDVVLFQQGTAYGFLVMAAKPGEQVPTSDASALAGAMDAHINVVLGATGSTGTTGTS